ncbi:MAG TPA: SMP-30/gluconolactonase/LRE family protein, partial [Anaeromyxobacteraceae bacterium]|nr:SMP-30/gluconolactonase/LRE family protein [Anaeromyxobacteraceae bacterium]
APMTSHLRLVALLVISLACGCRTSQPPPTTAKTPADIDPGVPFVRAWEANRNGQPERAMELLREAAALGWDIPLDPKDFPGISERREWKELAKSAAAREPRTANAEVAFTLHEKGLVAEGVAAEPETRDLFISSIRTRKILRVAPDGSVSDFVPSGGGGLLAPLGMKFDAERNLLWVAANASPAMVGWDPSMRGRSGLFAFDRKTGELRRSAFITGEKHLLNDVAIAKDGTVFVTDSEAGAVHRLDPGATELTPVVKGGFIYPNGIVISGDHVVFAHAFGLHAIPLAGGAASPVAGPFGFPLGGIDGLALDGTTAYAIQNGLGTPRIVRFEIDPALPVVTSASVVETRNSLWHVPTTGAFLRGSFLYIANSHVDALSDSGVAPEAMVETLVLKLPVK